MEQTEVRLEVESVVVHPEYNTGTLHDNDIALIKVKAGTPQFCSRGKVSLPLCGDDGVTSPCQVWPACPPQQGEDYSGLAHTEIVGWGAVVQGGGVTEVLMKSSVVTVTNTECVSVMGPGRITDNMICAGAEGTDTCQGDSGGPLTTRREAGAGFSVIGITSWGDGCARPDTLGVYTRLSQYLAWIEQQF